MVCREKRSPGTSFAWHQKRLLAQLRTHTDVSSSARLSERLVDAAITFIGYQP